MTANQINYWNLQENKRHNLVSEGTEKDKLSESKRHNVAGEQLESGKLYESQRHNVATENISLGSLFESSRHNKATESELQRHNVALETVDSGKLQESQRHNRYQEKLDTIDKTQLQPIKGLMGSSLMVSEGVDTLGDYVVADSPNLAIGTDAVKEAITPLRVAGILSGNPVVSIPSAGLVIRDTVANYKRQKNELKGGSQHAGQF